MAVIIKGSRTEKNLAAAYARESMAYNRYAYFASKAEKQGYQQISALFLETAANRLEHSGQFLEALHADLSPIPVVVVITATPIASTFNNLVAAEKSEKEDAGQVYQRYAEIATEEGFQAIAELFLTMGQIEQFHAERFAILAKQVETETVFKRARLVRWKCRNCGYVHEAMTAPKQCPACGHKQSFYEQNELLE
jgi:rubrerythrin